jgi:hypothetical protein
VTIRSFGDFNQWRRNAVRDLSTFTIARNRTAIVGVAALREGSVAKFQDHQRRAAECLRLAHDATDKTNKALLIEMAQTWAKLAEQEKARGEDGKTD